MAKILSKEKSKRGSCQYKIELEAGDVYVLGFDTDAPINQEPIFSFTLCNILDGYSKSTNGDLFNYVSRELAASGMVMPLFLMPDRNDERTRIGNRIRSLREDQKMEAKRLAQITDIDAANLSRIEQGKFSTGIDTLCKIATALNAQVDIIPNSGRNTNDGFSMRRKVWVLPSRNYNPIAPVPATGACYWPTDECMGFQPGDLVVFCSNSAEFGPIFIVAEPYLYKWDIPEHYSKYAPWPREADSYTKLSYHCPLEADLSNKICNLCKRRFNTVPTGATVLDVTELGI